MKLGIRIFIVLVCFFACNLDEPKDANPKAVELPTVAIEGLSHDIYKNGLKQISLKSKKLEIYSNQNKRILNDVDFFQYSDVGEVVAQGHAGYAVQNISTQDIEFSDKISISITQSQSSVEAQSLSWIYETSVFLGKSDEDAIIIKNRSKITGKGLYLDMVKRKLEFSGLTIGVLDE